MKRTLLLAQILVLSLTGMVHAVTPVMLPVAGGAGGVGYDFMISKYEVTVGQYTEFLNAVAKSDPNGLWDSAMMTGSYPIIVRTGSDGGYRYITPGTFRNHPISLVRGDSARRFCNWLHNGQGSTADTETGAYTMTSPTSTPARDSAALFFLPTYSEWSKAAYFNPTTGTFYMYPTSSNTPPVSTKPSVGNPNSANFLFDDGIPGNRINDGYAVLNISTLVWGKHVAPVGSYSAAKSPYGALEMGGSVSELIESSLTAHIGGSWGFPREDLELTHGVFFWINDVKTTQTGFRIASAPPPNVVISPLDAIVPVGSPTTFDAEFDGMGQITTYWKKATATVAGTTATPMPVTSYTIPSVALTHAGTYSAVGKNAIGSTNSLVANLAVVDTTTKVKHVFKATQVVSMTVSAAGTITGYQWKKDGIPLPPDDGRILGTITKKLTIKNLSDSDAGEYTCDVTSSAGTLESAIQTLYIVNAVPEISPGLTFNDAMVGGAYTAQATVSPGGAQAASKFVISGLPSGLKYNPATGEIYGAPTSAKTVTTSYTVKITAYNPIGKSSTVDVTLVVQPIPEGAVGTFVGLVERNSVLNSDLGGRLDLKTTAGGAYSGKITLGNTAYSFSRGKMDFNIGVNGSNTIIIKRRSPLLPLSLTWNVDPNSNLFTATILDTGTLDSAAISGWRNVWNSRLAPATPYLGNYTARLDSPAVAPGVIPEGDGYAYFTVPTSGLIRFAGKLPDHTSITVSTFVGPTGQLAIFQSLYRNTGSILAPLGLVSAGVDSSVGGTLNWLKKQQAASIKTYPDLFQTDLAVSGLLHNAVATGSNALGSEVTNAVYEFNFTGADLGLASKTPNALFALSAKNVATVPSPPVNFAGTRLSINARTGLFSGRFVLVDVVAGKNVTRTVSYQGIVVRNSAGIGVGYGYFMVGQLPTPTTLLTLSGGVRLGLP